MNSKKKILVIDDNELMRMMFSNIFWLHGLDDDYELITIGRADEAEKILVDKDKCPDIIFTGLVMPFEKDGKTITSAEAGFTILRRVKDDPALAHIRVVVLSSYDDASLKDEALALGAYQYLKKGESMPQDLIRIIRTLDEPAGNQL